MRLSRAARVTTAAITLVVVAAACSPGQSPTTPAGSSSAASSTGSTVSSDLPSPPAATQRGEVVERAPMQVDADGPLAGFTVTRVVYRSSSGYAPNDPDGGCR